MAARRSVAELGVGSPGGWVANAPLFPRWKYKIPPEYFFRTAARRGEPVHVFETWAFAREIRDLTRRGHLERRYTAGKPKRAGSLWEVRLTQKGRDYMEEQLALAAARA